MGSSYRPRAYMPQRYDRQQDQYGPYTPRPGPTDFRRPNPPQHNDYRPRGAPAGDFSFRSDRNLPPPPPPVGPPAGPWRNAPYPANTQVARPQRRAIPPSKKNNRGPPHLPNFNRPTSNRPLLKSRRSATPEQLPSADGKASRFKIVDDSSESETHEGSDHDVSTHMITPVNDQRAGAAVSGSDGAVTKNTDISTDGPSSGIKWSNPDPYTALPPPGEARKTKDFVRLIRKARVEQNAGVNKASGGGDFISLDADAPPPLPVGPPPPNVAQSRLRVTMNGPSLNTQNKTLLEGKLLLPFAHVVAG